MARDDLEEVLGRFARHRLIDQIPEVLRPWLLPIDWDRERLWSLDLPRKQIALEELRWHLDLPWWRHDGTWFQVTPKDFQAHPSAYPEHAERVASAELAYPLHVVRRRHRWLILDGIHRLIKAEVRGHDDLQVSTLRPMDIATIATSVG